MNDKGFMKQEKKIACLDTVCTTLNQFKLHPGREWLTENHIQYFAISAVFNEDTHEKAEKRLDEFKTKLSYRLPELIPLIEEVQTGGLSVFNWDNGDIEKTPFRYGLSIKEDNIEKALLILQSDHLLKSAYTKGAAAGALSQFFIPEVGQNIGSFLDRKAGGRLARVNTNARNCAEHEASRTIKNIKTKATSLGKCPSFSV